MMEPLSRQLVLPSPSRHLASGVVLVLFLMRFFYVAESAGQGDTLWIVALWFLGLMIWALVSLWSPACVVSFGWLDLSVGLLAAGHVASAVMVIGTSGEKRSAINLAWEWIGVLVGWFLLRQECRRAVFRREILVGLIATGTAVAGLGLYQHYFDLPQLAARYGRLFDRLKEADPVEAASIRQNLTNDRIPIDGPGFTLFEKRLRDSREPFGFFALANSLGGFLAVCLVLAVIIAASAREIDRSRIVETPASATRGKIATSNREAGDRGTLKRLWLWVLVIVFLGWCLLLTKSRTAWIGTAAGFALWSFGSRRVKLTWIRLSVVGGTLVILTIAGWGLSRIGGLDRQVFTEAPKSFQYRLQYWLATWPMIKDHLWLGVGPGQFRSHYLFYKLPEASEEISDPHNLLLDVAANGGLLALVGLLALCVSVVLKIRPQADNVEPLRSREGEPFVPQVVYGLTAIAWSVMLCTGFDDRLLVLLPIVVILYSGLRRMLGSCFDEERLLRIGSAAATGALLVHLLGAGGIEMPAVVLLILALVAVADGGRDSSKMPSWWISSRLSATTLVLSFGLLVAIFVTALRPVAIVQVKLREGDRLVQSGKREAADAEYQAAAAADPFWGEPWRRRAELAYRKAEADRFRSNESFLNAVHLMREAAARDPANFQDDQRLGDWWLSRWKVTSELKDAHEAVMAYERAWARYPTNAMLMAELAFSLDAAGTSQAASIVADKAIVQDKINRQRKHVDRFLADSVRAQLEKISAIPTGG